MVMSLKSKKSSPTPVAPTVLSIAESNARRWMLFVDGENFTIRAQDFAKAKGFPLHAGRYFEPNIFVWLPDIGARSSMIPHAPLPVQPAAIRAHYYTSATGDTDKLENL